MGRAEATVSVMVVEVVSVPVVVDGPGAAAKAVATAGDEAVAGDEVGVGTAGTPPCLPRKNALTCSVTSILSKRRWRR